MVWCKSNKDTRQSLSLPLAYGEPGVFLEGRLVLLDGWGVVGCFLPQLVEGRRVLGLARGIPLFVGVLADCV